MSPPHPTVHTHIAFLYPCSGRLTGCRDVYRLPVRHSSYNRRGDKRKTLYLFPKSNEAADFENCEIRRVCVCNKRAVEIGHMTSPSSVNGRVSRYRLMGPPLDVVLARFRGHASDPSLRVENSTFPPPHQNGGNSRLHCIAQKIWGVLRVASMKQSSAQRRVRVPIIEPTTRWVLPSVISENFRGLRP